MASTMFNCRSHKCNCTSLARNIWILTPVEMPSLCTENRCCRNAINALVVHGEQMSWIMRLEPLKVFSMMLPMLTFDWWCCSAKTGDVQTPGEEESGHTNHAPNTDVFTYYPNVWALETIIFRIQRAPISAARSNSLELPLVSKPIDRRCRLPHLLKMPPSSSQQSCLRFLGGLRRGVKGISSKMPAKIQV